MWNPKYINELVKIKEIFSFIIQECEPDYHFKGESHNFWECLYVMEGSLLVSADERVYKMERNQLIFHKPLEQHKFYVDSGKGAKILVFTFTLQGELNTYFENKVFFLSAEQQQIISSMLKYACSRLDTLEIPPDVNFYKKYMLPFNHIKTFPQMLVTYIYQLLLSLADNGETSETYQTVESDTFKCAVNYMNANIQLPLSINEISAHCNVSQATLKRIFTRYTGIGIHKYFLQLKINRATELLQAGESVSRTAELMGFSSQGYFSATFKRETGISPSEI